MAVVAVDGERLGSRCRSGQCARRRCLEHLVTPAKPHLKLFSRLESPLFAQRALPDNRDPPPGLEKIVLIPLVPVDIGTELGLPEMLVRGGRGRMFTPSVAVPKAAVYEANSSKPTKHQIRRTGQRWVMKPIP